MNRIPAALPMPPALPAAEGRRRKTLTSFLTRRAVCLAPRCSERQGGRVWFRPHAFELQEGACCSPECLVESLDELISQWLPTAFVRRPHTHRIPLGLLLLSRGVIDAPTLRRALQARPQDENLRMGEWLVKENVAREEDVTAGVAMQWGRPLFPLAQSQGWRLCRGWFPLALQESLRMLPLHFDAGQQLIYVGFTQAIDFSALDAITRISCCRTEPCIVADSAFDAVLEELRRPLPKSPKIVDDAFTDVSQPGEIAALVCEYATRLHASQIRFAVCANYLWVRLQGEAISHLTFRIP